MRVQQALRERETARASLSLHAREGEITSAIATLKRQKRAIEKQLATKEDELAELLNVAPPAANLHSGGAPGTPGVSTAAPAKRTRGDAAAALVSPVPGGVRPKSGRADSRGERAQRGSTLRPSE